MNMNDTGNRVIGVVVVALLIIGAWYLGTKSKIPSMTNNAGDTSGMTDTTNGSNSGTTDTSGSSSSNGSSIQVGGEAVAVKNQPAGSFVVVESVSLGQTGWVAVRDAGGRTLGAARLEAGTHEAVQVELLRNTESGQNYQVLVYADDGDKMFDLHKDTLVTNSDGSVVGASFLALHGD